MASRLVIIDAQSILNLLVHYMDGHDIPLDSELVALGVNPMLQRLVGLQVRSDRWPECPVNAAGVPEPLQIRYHGNRILSWTDNDDQSVASRSYQQRNETPRR